mmetsp:Transcript_5731/g.15796  ORF Transcript_5731/g.15796 Transcript_5731/m.15796 type:complete len:257 (-) Transcript_5731:157-927(-)
MERNVATKHDVKDDPATPDVASLRVLLREHLRRHVRGRARRPHQHLAGLDGAGEAEVRDLQGALVQGAGLVDQAVVRLQVSVADFVLVQVEDRPKDLLHHNSSDRLGEENSPLDMVLQASACAHLQNEVQVLGVLHHLVQHEEVRMVQLLHDLNLQLDDGVLRPHFLFVDGLDCAHRASCFYRALPHHAEGALSEHLLVQVVMSVHVIAALDDKLQGAGRLQAHSVRHQEAPGPSPLVPPEVARRPAARRRAAGAV